MGIYGALSTAVTGLRAQSYALENISGNIANSQTVGYKRVETDFIDLIPDAPLKRQIPGAVIAQSRGTNTVQGDVKTSSVETFIALNGSGFFVVEPKIGVSDGQSVFSGSNYFTRRGDFELDKNGNLVNGAGYYLKGLPIDPVTGNVSGSVPEVIKISNAFVPAQATTQIDYQLNLPQLPKNTGYDPAVPNSELLNPANYNNNPIAAGAGNGVVQAQDNGLFLENSLSGGAITVYAPNGAPAQVQIRWAKTDSVAAGGTDTWTAFYLSNANATGTGAMWTAVNNAGTPVQYQFGANGSMNPQVPTVTLTGLTVNGITIGDVTLTHGVNGVTEFNDPSGVVNTSKLAQNGYGAGEYVSVAVSDNGRIVASYSNGQQVDLAQIVIANFNGANQLKRMDGGVFAATTESGEPIFDNSGSVIGGALESSNSDISDEFTKLIVTQQAYAAGTRIVTTADEMLQEALNMVR